MSDERVQELLRRWRTTGAAADRDAYSAQALRAGLVPPRWIEIAARLGHEGARTTLGWPAGAVTSSIEIARELAEVWLPPPRHVEWWEELPEQPDDGVDDQLARRLASRVARAVVLGVLPAWDVQQGPPVPLVRLLQSIPSDRETPGGQGQIARREADPSQLMALLDGREDPASDALLAVMGAFNGRGDFDPHELRGALERALRAASETTRAALLEHVATWFLLPPPEGPLAPRGPAAPCDRPWELIAAANRIEERVRLGQLDRVWVGQAADLGYLPAVGALQALGAGGTASAREQLIAVLRLAGGLECAERPMDEWRRLDVRRALDECLPALVPGASGVGVPEGARGTLAGAACDVACAPTEERAWSAYTDALDSLEEEVRDDVLRRVGAALVGELVPPAKRAWALFHVRHASVELDRSPLRGGFLGWLLGR